LSSQAAGLWQASRLEGPPSIDKASGGHEICASNERFH